MIVGNLLYKASSPDSIKLFKANIIFFFLQTQPHTHHIQLKPDIILTTFLHTYRIYTLSSTIPDIYTSL